MSSQIEETVVNVEEPVITAPATPDKQHRKRHTSSTSGKKEKKEKKSEKKEKTEKKEWNQRNLLEKWKGKMGFYYLYLILKDY